TSGPCCRDVRYGSLADIRKRIRDVRFIPKSRHGHRRHQCLLSAISIDLSADKLLPVRPATLRHFLRGGGRTGSNPVMVRSIAGPGVRRGYAASERISPRTGEFTEWLSHPRRARDRHDKTQGTAASS